MKDLEKTGEKEIVAGKVLAMLSYLPFLCLISLLFHKENKFISFHAKQGLVLFLGLVSISVLSIIPVIGPIIFWLGLALIVVLSALGFFQALLGRFWKCPLVTGLAEQISF
jgi:uncharacterized membrane protein